MPSPRQDEFYVGYLPSAPQAVAARTRLAVVVVLVVAVIVALTLVVNQRPFASSAFEFGVERRFTGLIRERPYPALEVRRPGLPAGSSSTSTYLLVAFGKRGAADLVSGYDGQPVKLGGSLVYRDSQTMIEVHGSIEPLSGETARDLLSAPMPSKTDLGTQTLRGEIVDSKCFLGVMKPGNLKPHRSCATRCISGGIPPVLLVRGEDGTATYFLLVSEDQRPVNDDVLDRVAQPVSITGRIMRLGDLLVLAADPATYRLLD